MTSGTERREKDEHGTPGYDTPGQYSTGEDYGPQPRWDDPLKMIPIVFVLCIISFLYYVYVFKHCIPGLQLDEEDETFIDNQVKDKAYNQLIWINIFTGLVILTYLMCIFTDPGSVPDGDPRWEYDAPEDAHRGLKPISLQERKRTGDRRHCKWCGKYKPDRCHHCRVCRVCVLKMDHHCPWIYNCVGFRNYKMFFLLLFYAMIDCHLIVWTMAPTVMEVLTTKDVPFMEMFLLLFGETVGFFFCILLTFFFGFHIWLMCMAMTTIEFCEKALPKDEGEIKEYDSSVFNLGWVGNITAVVGHNPLCWLIPCAPSPGDGCDYVQDTVALALRARRQKEKEGQKDAEGDYYGAYGTSASLPAYAGAAQLDASQGYYPYGYHSGGGGYGEEYGVR